MNKEEFIKRYGGEAYEKVLEQNRQWAEANPEKIKAKDHERNRKGGKYYDKKRAYLKMGVPGERNIVRTIHARRWRKYKRIIAPDSQIHHEWLSGTSRYRGIALVERDAHQHGIIDVIEILEGAITVLLEERRELAPMCQ
jgi:hypothetical protein